MRWLVAIAVLLTPLAGHAQRPSLAQAAAARARAAERYGAGDPGAAAEACAGVLARPGDDELACRLLVASAALERHDPAAAAAAIGPARGRLGVLEPYGALLLGRALAQQGEERAAAILDEALAADPDGPLARAAEVPAALALAHAGDLDQATSRIRKLLTRRRGEAAALELALAEATLAAGDAARASALYLSVWRDRAGAAEAERASARLEELRSRGVKVEPSIADRLSRAAALLDRGLAGSALAEIDVAGSSSQQAALLRGRALVALGRRDDAERALLACTSAKADRQIAAEALQLRARIAMRAGEVDAAVALLDRVEGPDSDEASFLAAFFAYDAGRFAEAERRFRDHLAKEPRSRRRDEARWYVGWTLLKQDRAAEAAAELGLLDAEFPRSDLVPQARYWRARALERAGKAAAAHADLLLVARTWPGSWYGQLARQRLADEAAALTLGARRADLPRSFTPRDSTTAARLERAAALYAAGLSELAGDELQAAIGRSRDRQLLAAAGALARAARDGERALRIGVDRLGGLSGASDLAYPEAFPHEVDRAARAFEVEPELVWSIMRRESQFRPRVRSAAAAVGLMQVLPSTASRIGAILGLPPGIEERLEDPAVNVALGTWYLAELVGRAGGSYALAAACYNAGPAAVGRWLDDPLRKGLPLDEFVESIPYRETRGYVKAVMADVQIYRALRGLPPLPLLDPVAGIAPGATF